ncbi:UNVERIFIED_CONTAM: Histone-lysine N-methyltransferase ASHH2 [Sesamum radiatum]|uniref:Histone-lysine N-methyltransferase ASHH2 n=1 Tax=Sesamum radiatum TaxID=300843 RepID=A0AAW2M6F4_SESRA
MRVAYGFDIFYCQGLAKITQMKTSLTAQFLKRNQTQKSMKSWKYLMLPVRRMAVVMVCHCKPPSDGRMGCGAKCLNRMLNIECVQGTCPCGELCSNQQFQKRKYAKLKWFRCGKKGYGLQALEDISEGQFLIEYVGEVLDVHAYEARQREYALNGHKHFYFMTLNGSEVIDACAKGNLGRFINHSCDPNCRTEKWMVNGEVCIGLFSLRDIKKGEEVTFDYNYVRVFGAAAKKCVCGSPNCRGYIGGDPLNSEVVVQDDSEDEYLEPVMICGDRDMNDDWNDIMSNSLNGGQHEIASKPPANKYNMKKQISTVGESITESHTSEHLSHKVEGVKTVQVEKSMVQDRSEVENSIANDSVTDAVERLDIKKITGQSLNGSASATSKVESEGLQSQMHSSSQLMDISYQSDCVETKAMSSTHELAIMTASPINSLSDMVESKRKLKYAAVGGRNELPKSSSLAKTNSSSSIRKGKHKMNVVNDKETSDVDTLNAAAEKSKKLPELSVNNRFEAVEENLNELLDPEGGISKRKDASKGYLKLLFLTAASGNNGHGEAIQSNRDLSMILDALLKTKSRTVLVDIINKNGLQMLHNIMKRYRKEFIKTPILRKLLKP